MTAYRQFIRVIYPQDGGRIALRTDENWDADAEALRRNGCTTEFQLESDRPYFYFKRYCSTMARPCGRGEKIVSPSQRRARPCESIPLFVKTRTAAYVS